MIKVRPIVSVRSFNQHGVSLVIVMIFLVILSVLGVSAIQTSTLSSRIARNESDRNLAFQAAEAALRDGELDVRNKRFDKSQCVKGVGGCRVQLTEGGTYFVPACAFGRCAVVVGAAPVWETASRWTTTGGSVNYGRYTGAADLPLVAQQPRYLLEYLSVTTNPAYRITAVGFGANTSSQVMLQIVVIVDKNRQL